MIWTGEISTSQNGEEVEWRIFDFFGLSEKHSLGYSSPDFHVGDDRWNLVIFPNGHSEHDTYGHVDLELCKKSAASYVIQKFSLSLKTVKGEKENEKECAEMFDSWDYHSILRFIPRSELSRRRFELVPDGVLTVICTMKNWAYAESSRHKENSERRGVDATTQTEQNKIAIEKLLHDMKRMMVRGDHSDVTLSVRGEEFRLHRNILGSRNSYFSSIFNDESQESTPATLPIDDCDPHQFRTLIHFIYTGTADNLCPENVCGLYEVAVAYQEQHMKSDCLQLMMNTLSVDNFCDYTALALKNQEKELLQKAAKLLGRKTKEIIRHEKWEAFLERYPKQASELYMKALDQFGEK